MKAYDNYTDDELAAIAGVNLTKSSSPQKDYNQYSDEELMQIAGVNPAKVTKKESFARGALQVATFGASDEAYGGIRSFTRDISRAIESKLYGDNMLSPISYEQARAESAAANKAAQEANPGYYLGGEITGAIGTGGFGAATKTGKAIANSVRSGNTKARLAKSAIAGATSGGLYGAGNAEPGERLEGAKTGAGYGAAFGAAGVAAPAAIRNVVKGTKTAGTGVIARGAEQLERDAARIKSGSTAAYKEMRDAGALINGTKTQELVQNIDKELSDIKLNGELHKQTLSLLSDVSEAAKKGELDLEELDQFRRLFTRVKSINGEDEFAAGKVVDAIDDIVEGLKATDLTKGDIKAVKALDTARSEYKRFRKFDTVASVIEKADGDPNKIKNGLNSLLNNNKKIRGFSDQEKEVLRNAAKASAPEKVLKGLGRFGIEPNNVFLPFVGGSITGASLGTPTGAALVAAGTVARQLNKYLSRGKAEEALRVIERGGIPKELAKLPPKEANKIISLIKGQKGITPISQKVEEEVNK